MLCVHWAETFLMLDKREHERGLSYFNYRFGSEEAAQNRISLQNYEDKPKKPSQKNRYKIRKNFQEPKIISLKQL